MTHVFRSIADLRQIAGPQFLAIGVFDGVHLGHRAVIEAALNGARRAGGTAVVVTFDPHPARILRPGQAPRLLTSTQHKIRLMEALGVQHLLVIPFDAKFAATPPEEFIAELAAGAAPLREICVGFEWCFGKGRAGNLALLDQLGARLGFEERGVPPVRIDGQIVSSTLIRSAVEAGDFAAAARYLGRDYTVLGRVVEGARLGRTIGFPTANLSAHNEQFPPDGVYAVEITRLATNRLQAETGVAVEGALVAALAGMANIGVRPTIAQAGGEHVFEVHIFDFDQSIYGEDLEITFRHFLRPEQKFHGLEELRAQLRKDAATAKEHLR